MYADLIYVIHTIKTPNAHAINDMLSEKTSNIVCNFLGSKPAILDQNFEEIFDQNLI